MNLINDKIHLSLAGLSQIVNIKASMNLGLSDMLKSEFNLFNPVDRKIINTENIPDPNWIAGFVTGEGNFDVRVTENLSYKLGSRVQLRFRISQHERDKKLMDLIILYWGSGKLYKYPGKPAFAISVVKFSDITDIIIPFFEKYPILGVKFLDYLDWCKIAKLMAEGSHLSLEGLNLIKGIKAGMNKSRSTFIGEILTSSVDPRSKD